MPEKQLNKLSDLINIGPKVEEGLLEIGIKNADDLIKIGAVEAFCRMRLIDPKWNNKMLLYALHGAITNTNCMSLSGKLKENLIKELNENS